MPRFHDISIKNKLRLLIVLTSAILLVLVFSAFIITEVLIFRHSMTTDLLALADLIGMNSTAGIVFDDQDATTENVASLRAKPHIILAHIFLADGKVFASYFRNKKVYYNKSISIEDYYFLIPELQDGTQLTGNDYFFRNDFVEVFKTIILKNEAIGTVYIRSDLTELNERLQWTGSITFIVLLVALIFGFVIASKIQALITTPLNSLLKTMKIVSKQKNYSIREDKINNDELGHLVDGFNEMIAHIEGRDQALAVANQKITALNQRLEAENLRMSAELDITRQLQQMVLPKVTELQQIKDLDIAGFMEPADEVGGDYYDVLEYNGRVKIGIGDVTGHGLESGVLMLMVQMAVRTLFISGITNPERFLNVLNRVIYDNVQRIQMDKNLTLSLLDYQAGQLRLTGQHEDILLVRKNGDIEQIDTLDLGFAVGLKADISHLVSQLELSLQPGEVVILYTDGITEALNFNKKQYGVKRLRTIVNHYWQQSASEIQQAIIADVRQHIGKQKVFDDITVLVVKRRV